MLNPSTADEEQDDPTIRRCIGYAQQWGYGTLVVCNLSAYRATDADEMLAHAEPFEIFEQNLFNIIEAARDADCVVAAWGAHADRLDPLRYDAMPLERDRVAVTLASLRLAKPSIYCLGRSKSGQPRHPLMMPAGAPLSIYRNP